MRIIPLVAGAVLVLAVACSSGDGAQPAVQQTAATGTADALDELLGDLERDANSARDRTAAIREEAYDTGYSEGYDEGSNDGYDEGYTVGYDDGYSEGYDEGCRDLGETLLNSGALTWYRC